MSDHSKQLHFERMFAAMQMIAEICENECIGPSRHESGEQCIGCDIYVIAHGAAGCCDGCPVSNAGRKMIIAKHQENRKERHGPVEETISIP